VPIATGLAYKLGWLTEDFARDGVSVATLQEGPGALARHHYDHGLIDTVGGDTLKRSFGVVRKGDSC
jgi:hypothetical protein